MPAIYSYQAVAVLSGYALSEGRSPGLVAVLLGSLVAFLRVSLATHDTSHRFSYLLGLFAALSAGSLLAFVFSSPQLATVLPSFETALLLGLSTTLTLVFPLFVLALSEVLLQRLAAPGEWTSVIVPALAFVVAGSLQAHLGVGRTLWWIKTDGSASFWRAIGGPQMLDFLYAGLGSAGAGLSMELAGLSALAQSGGAPTNQTSTPDLSSFEETPTDDTATAHREVVAGPSSGSETCESPLPKLSIPFLRPFVLFLLLISIGPLIPNRTFHPSRPSATDRDFRYPLLKVGCVVPPKGGKGTVEEWLKESRVVAARGAKIMSWSEGAVRIERGNEGSGTGWDARCDGEKRFLQQVAEVADAHKVFIVTAYTMHAPPQYPRHKMSNLVAVVGPTLHPNNEPNIVLATPKRLPVPFIESYTHMSSSSEPPPFESIQLPVPHHPHLPAQDVTLSAQICLDISSPSLSHFSYQHSPQLILNPSSTPLNAFAVSQFHQVSARAREHNAFILRCDSPASQTGISGLVGPDGNVLVVRNEDGGGSWEAEIQIERATGGTVWELIGGEKGWWGTVGIVLLLGAGAKRVMRLDYSAGGMKARVRSWLSWARREEQLLIDVESHVA